MIHTLSTRQTVEASPEEVWDFFSRPENLNRITPPSLDFRILSREEPSIYSGQIIQYGIRILPLVRVRWLTEIKHVVPYQFFVDEQRLGPYRFWYHCHQFIPGEKGVEIIDSVHYAIGYSVLGEAVHRLWVRKQLNEIFAYRQKVIGDLFGSTGEK